MNKPGIKSELIKIAASLIRGDHIPSDNTDDYPQKTYSASRVANMMSNPRIYLKTLGIALKRIAREKAAPPEKCSGQGVRKRLGCR